MSEVFVPSTLGDLVPRPCAGGRWCNKSRYFSCVIADQGHHIEKIGASTDEKCVAMDLAELRHSIDQGYLISWMPTRKMVADCLTKHFTLDEEIAAIVDLVKTGRMLFRYDDDGHGRALTAAQLNAEALENGSHKED